tara:strand:- start:128 stop:1201 length:1074 start_codon:yes stop_codon:yes gene_type:complete
MYKNLLFEEFKKSPNASGYQHIDFLVFEEFTQKDIDIIKRNDLGQKKCVFLCISEPHWYDIGARVSKQFIQFIGLLKEQGIFNVDFYVPCFGDRFTEDFAILNKNGVGWTFLKYITDIPYMQDIAETSKMEPSIDLEIDKIKHNFLHMNRTHRMHRQLFSKFLIQENLLEKNCVSINSISENNGGDGLSTQYKDACIPVGQKDEWFYNQNLLDLWRDVHLQNHRHPAIDQNIKQPVYDFIKVGAIYVVSETVFDHPYPVFSEKTVSALLSKRPFIIIGPAYSLTALKEKGYKTWAEFIDQSYDHIEDPNERLEKIFELVKRISGTPLDHLRENVLQSKDKIMHNQNLILKNIRKYTK